MDCLKIIKYKCKYFKISKRALIFDYLSISNAFAFVKSIVKIAITENIYFLFVFSCLFGPLVC